MGIFYAVLAYLAWGIAPVYWKLLADVPPFPLLAHRVVWSLPFMLLLIAARGRTRAFWDAWADREAMRRHLAGAALLAVNWFAFLWAVAHGRVLEVSFGYFLCPLLSVSLGCLIERERLGGLQKAALICAFAGILVLAGSAADFPFAGLAMAVSWAIYGLMKKRSRLGAINSFSVEASLLFVPSAFLLLLDPRHLEALAGGESLGLTSWILLASTGVVTAVPLLLFAEAAPRVRLSTMGMLQYLVPSCNFLLAVGLYREPFSGHQAWAFAAIWLGLILYSLGSRRPPVPPPVPIRGLS